MPLRELLRFTYDMFRPPKAQTVSEWADENRVLVSESSSEPGRWRTDRAPYQRAIMDAFNQPGVNEIVVMASAQTGKSESELNMMGYAIDVDPGPILYIQPTEKTAEDYSKRRVAPMIAGCPSLRNKVNRAKGRDAENTITMKTFPGGSLTIIGANSPSDLSSKPVRYIFMDEIDRFPVSAGTEGDPIELAERRTETYRHNRKIVKTSTPTIKGVSKIEKAYMKGTQEEWHTRCPHCGEYSYIRFDDVKFDIDKFTDESGENHYTVDNTRWHCPLCGEETGEYKTKRLPAKWVVKNERALQNGVRSFHLNAFMSPWSDWKDIARKFLQAKKDPELLKTFHNTMLGESWEIRERTQEPERMYERREHYNAEVPSGVLVMTMGVDTQDNRLEYEVVGWSRDEESWGIARGIIPGRPDSPGVWEELDDVLDREWKLKNGMRMRVLATFVDSGGHFTQEVYAECERRRSKHVFAIKGESGENKAYVRQMKTSARTADNAKFLVAVDCGKTSIMYNMTVAEAGAKYMHFPIDYKCGYDMEYFKGLCSERTIIKRRNGQTVIAWEKIYERNEPLDCRNYALAAYRYFNWNFDKYEMMLNGEETEKAITKAQAVRQRPHRVISRGIQV